MNNLYKAIKLKKDYLFCKIHKCQCPSCKPFDERVMKEIKQLKEEVEKGCGKSIEKNIYGNIFCYSKKCKECQETLKILNEILGDKQ